MPLMQRPLYQVPDFWNVFGHSYMNFTVGTLHQTGRADAIFRGSLDIEHMNWRNYASTGAQLTVQGRSQGGAARVLQEVTKSTRTSPYAGEGGAALFCWGINDMGNQGVGVQPRTAFQHALRTVISRWRAAGIYENNYNLGSGPGQIAYGAGFTENSGTQDFTSGTSVHRATVTTSATITITLPSDYKGQPLALCFSGAAGAFGGTVTFTGTAGVTGTFSTSNIIGSANHVPIIRRITNLTSAAAGLTVIMTMTQVDASGAVEFDCWWIEADNPPPVIVCNIARLLPAGYAGYAQPVTDGDVATWNTAISDVCAEFDSMVQIADIDTALAKDANLIFPGDGVHPNEYGAARIADALLAAIKKLSPNTTLGIAAQMNVSAPRDGGVVVPRYSNAWYTSPCAGVGTAYTVVAGDQFAIPMPVTEARERWINYCLEATTSVTGTAVRMGVYDDIGSTGYPMCLVAEATSAGAFTITSGTGVKVNPNIGSAGSLNQPLDPGLYWLVIKFTTVGVTHTFRTIKGPSLYMPNLSSTGAMGTTMPGGYKHTGQGTGALPTTYPSGGVLTESCPYIGVKIF